METVGPDAVAAYNRAARAHEHVVDESLLIWVVHATNPHVANKNVRGYVQAQHWFQDLTTLS